MHTKPEISRADAGAKPSAGSKIPPEVLAASDEWPLANRTYTGDRATRASRISSANVATLREAWSFQLSTGGAYGAGSSSSLVLDGVVYFVDGQNNVFALDGKTGSLKWQQRYDATGALPNGIAVGWGKLFTASGDDSFVALDLETGRELWRAPIDVSRYGGIGIAPIAYGGLVYLSTVPLNSGSQYLGGVNGTLYALEQETGQIRWSFQTVEDTTLWGNPTVNSGGGAWYPPTIDLERGEMYWGIGNPGPYPGTPEFPSGSSRPGDNLYTSSVVALSPGDGELHWYHQERPHDLFDLDFQNSPLVVSVTSDGAKRPLVVGSGKTGTIVALDPEQGGKLLWRAVVGRHENDELQEVPSTGVTVYPGTFGGVETPMAFADDTVYAAVVNWGTNYLPSAFAGFDGEGSGEVVAVSAIDGSVRWKRDFETPVMGGMTVVNDLLFTATLAGEIYALNRADGSIAWQGQAPLGINAPITVSGDQVLVAAGLGLGVPKLVALGLDAPEAPPKTVVAPEPVLPAVDPRADKLSDTGLYADIATRTLAEGVWPFAPQGTLWSDGADKHRWVYLPPGTAIDSANMDDWIFPVGTKFWKEFSIAGKRIETRLLEKRSADDWRMIAFLWDADGSEARALPRGQRNALGTEHDIPNQDYCVRCHGGVADIALGFNAAQLGEGSGLTTATLVQAGRLTAPPTTALRVPGDDTARAALLYLHANCNGCHNPRTFISNATGVDFSLPVASLGNVETTPVYATIAQDLMGGLKESSVLQRIGARGIQGQMPPIASEKVDEAGLAAVTAWMATVQP
ncbi:MAG TPA: PQQ-binding-like beta-propeller repeat protein [Polyangiales bacterium]|nr:PQQ-binding-like beta-propeller repeat protein [Polyangiales bacterium]